MAQSPADRTLRLITIWAWIPAISLLIPYGVYTAQIVPPLALIPMTFSAIFGLHKVLSKSSNRGFTIFMDVFIANFLVSIIVPGLVFMTRIHYWRWNGMSMLMLGSFATCPLLLNFAIHSFFVLREMKINVWIARLFSSPTCPHCNRDLRLLWDMTPGGSSTHSQDSKDTYVAVPREVTGDDVEAGPSMAETPRPSTDDETARLL